MLKNPNQNWISLNSMAEWREISDNSTYCQAVSRSDYSVSVPKFRDFI